ncbi:AraC family transcriptional regulator [Cohnella ginsengisoli]|uniref:AraC family transcriptional regulator n=1 Tax=Cohnella ginsengisoli TaxID=425004 RepID=A0A9X4KFN4_9BACL|nr:AraC family transcriptional regulator [Cohnella ginsengisoli]MDG0791258.1 AraC family transcriptional regulator [Cohnella ginsengisoli]
MDALSEVGGKPEEAGIDVQALWQGIHEADTLTKLEAVITQFIQNCMETAAVLKRKQHTETIAKTMDFIERHYREDLSLKEISTNVYLSPGYLSTIFKNETGMTIYDYITQVRMKAAGDLVLDPDVKIQDVASAVGYNNIQSFIRFFKKAYKMTPLEYRRSRKTSG